MRRPGDKAPFDSPIIGVLFVVIFMVGGGFAGLLLGLADTVRRRVAGREPVNPILRAYFARGVWSIVLWFPTVILAVFFVMIFVLMLTTR
jgi:hypothetical protein